MSGGERSTSLGSITFPADEASGRASWAWSGIIIALVLAGVLARLEFYLQARSFWQDEAVMALNVLTRPLGALVSGPLEFLQTAPPLFLAWEWLQSRLFGAGELSLRFPSLVAGLLTPIAAWWAARPLFGNVGRVVAVGLVCLGPYLIGYSAELKPYAFDALFAVVCLGLVARIPQGRSSTSALLAAGLVGITFSVGIPFVLASAWFALVLHPTVRADRALLRKLVYAGFAWAALFGLIYIPVYRPTASDPDMLAFWNEGFMRGPLREQFFLHRNWIVSTLFHDAFVPARFGVLVTLLAAVGALGLWRKKGLWAAVAVVGPLALVYLASAAGRYPIEARLVLFAAPAVAFSVAAGVETLHGGFDNRAWRGAWMVVALALVVPGFGGSVTGSIRTEYRGEMRPLLENPEFRSRPDEPVYVFSKAMPSWIFYSTDWSQLDREEVNALKRAAMEIGPNSGNVAPREAPVLEEGWDLVLQTGPRPTLVGIGSGFQAIYRRDWAYRPAVDEGWAANEASRLAAQPGSCFWLVFTHFKPEESGALRTEMEARGMVLEHERAEPGAQMARYCEPAGTKD